MEKIDSKAKWFSQARFGMFIHWGIYSITGGEWKGKVTPWVSEWMMRKFKIPMEEYKSLASGFNPSSFNAKHWVKMAKDAGMKYIVITAKHHDGFAMFHSCYNSYNIIDATPFGRDPIAELAEACQNNGIRLGLYYSQDQDWHEAGGSGNDWDFPEHTPEQFANYLENKVKFQLKELLSNYGKISIIWFDTPVTISDKQSQMLKDYVQQLQPDCLVSGRVGNGKGDYESLGDNELPNWPKEHLCEGLGTMNESWGYKVGAECYRSSEELLMNLCEMTGKNVNYLLNVGPNGRGEFPKQAVKLLREIAKWYAMNGEGIHCAGALNTPMCFRPLWGFPTAKDNAIYLHIFRRFSNILPMWGIKNQVKKANVLGYNIQINVDETHDPKFDYHCHNVECPDLPLPYTIRLITNGLVDTNEKAYNSH